MRVLYLFIFGLFYVLGVSASQNINKEMLINIANQIKILNQQKLTEQTKEQLSILHERQIIVWNQLAHEMAEQQYNNLLSPNNASIEHQENCLKIESEEQCKKRAIKNALIKLADSGGTVSVQSSSQLNTQRQQTNDQVNSEESFSQQTNLNSENEILTYKLEHAELKYNKIIKQKLWWLRLSGKVVATRNNDYYQSLVAQIKQQLLPLLAQTKELNGEQEKIIYIKDEIIELLRLPSGEFVFGSNVGDKAETPESVVHVNSFYLAKTEVSTQLYLYCVQALRCPDNTMLSNRADFPLYNISWQAINEHFIPWLSETTGESFRLPTEQEWEYAAKLNLNALQNCSNESFAVNNEQCSQLGSIDGPDLGRYGFKHLLSNVSEWTGDCWRASHDGMQKCEQMTVKGGSWYHSPYYRRPSARFAAIKTHRTDTIGLRLALSASNK